MIKLIISTDCILIPELKHTLDRFAKMGSLMWLLNAATVPADCSPMGPVIHSLNDIPSSDKLLILVTANSEELPDFDRDPRILRVFQRSGSERSDPTSSIVVDDYAQLELLADLSDYPNLARLVGARGKTMDDYRSDILARYAVALNALRSQRRAVVFGAQRLGETVAKSLQSAGYLVTSFVDNGTSKHGSRIFDIIVQPLSALIDKTLPIVIATTRYTSSITRQLKNEGFCNILPYAVMSLVDPEGYPDEIPYIGIQQDFAEHVAQYIGLFVALSDEKSRRVLDGLIGYRLDYNALLAESVADEYSQQYFDQQLIPSNGHDVFVDLGGYDGDTAEKFIQYTKKDYAKIYIFEPNPNLLKLAKERLIEFNKIDFIAAGAYSYDGELSFDSSGLYSGSICEGGKAVIPVRCIDKVMTDVPTFIKLDIEGAEINALRGAENTIRDSKPKLAIAAYHFASDLWRIVDVVREINPSYQFYLRHYSETGTESVIYAV